MSGAAGDGFDDALLGADGTAEPRRHTVYSDALALDTPTEQVWGGVEPPRPPVAPGSDEWAARALVEADPPPDVRAARPVPAVGPALVPAPRVSWSAPAGRGGTQGWPGPVRGRPVPPWTGPDPRLAAGSMQTIRSSASGSVALLVIFLVVLVVAYLLVR